MKIEAWADFHCPYCLIGKERLNVALKQLGLAEQAQVIPRSFLLNLDSDEPDGVSMAEHVQLEYGGEIDDILKGFEDLAEEARGDGLKLDMAGARYARMMDPHRLLQYAKTKGLGNELFRRAQELLFEEGVLLSDHRVLLRVAREVGLDEAEARAVLDSDRFHQEVLADDGIAREMVIDYVPYYVVDGKHHFSGDLTLQDYLDNLKKAANQ
ncbi:MAG TPA: DsbA family oxidoreductase [Clostridiales bacterium]|jgi:predicted DsbA family dithiol-disulfide isomerase|nr:DsbA family oxidoreductase [Clostridiales bacterium]